jgi:urease accessory protein
MSAAEAARFAPALRVGADGAVDATSSSGFHWIVHRLPTPVVFLTTPLLALGDGEELDASVEVQGQSSIVVTTQGPTLLLRTGATVAQRWSLTLAEGSHLTFLPWLTIPFPGSRSSLRVAARVAAGASLVAWDVLAVGRIARGERFLFDELSSRWVLSDPASVLLEDRLRVRGNDAEPAGATLAGRTHVGSLYVAGVDEAALPVAGVRRLLEGGLELVGASRPTPGTLVVRALDRTAERIEQAFWPVVAAARQAAGVPMLQPGDAARRWF